YTHMDRARDMVDIDVRDGLESTLALFATRMREKGVTLERDYAHALPRIRAYPGDLNQVWSNLFDNALDAVAPGTGRISVRTGVEEGAVVVEIRDNGPGIPPELQDRIWEPFFTTKDVGSGTGLGLDVARRIVVDQHGGQLFLTSSPGDTRFTVQLPLTTVGTFGV
ncbi:MAG: ATP-binding protein, partial [Chloroflexota bacterium]|nr:ATP-binding protein [Chloroflexota bacterium]